MDDTKTCQDIVAELDEMEKYLIERLETEKIK